MNIAQLIFSVGGRWFGGNRYSFGSGPAVRMHRGRQKYVKSIPAVDQEEKPTDTPFRWKHYKIPTVKNLKNE